ncbi:hypothetical protein EB796_007380 [Bugula neritina]|uniref:Uncharacterized protein n=1 Tax=Bugula neritina TaxID=10212 RepID=A0A7J7K7U7_BUGNE|nr:hypothetical protein EB796_007380 [Bugula neritina]
MYILTILLPYKSLFKLLSWSLLFIIDSPTLYLKARWSGKVRKGVSLNTRRNTEQISSYEARCGLIMA